MKILKMSCLAGFMLLALPCFAFAENASGQIQFKTGEMGLLPFLEMVSEKLDIQIDASEIGPFGSIALTVPELGPLSIERAQAVALTCLYLQGYTWIHDSKHDLYRVLRQRDARDQELPLITEAKDLPDSDLLVSYIMHLEHTPAEAVARTLRSFMPANSRIIPHEAAKSVIITDTGHNISKLKKLIERLDTSEAAKDAKEWMIARAKKSETDCPVATSIQGPQPYVMIALFSLIALVIGFLARGYVIRRIEGGL